MNQHDAIVTALSQLGTTPTDVAEALRKHGITGVRNTVRHLNPIVRFLQQILLIDEYVLQLYQNGERPHYLLLLSRPDGSTQEIAIPEAVEHFLDAFNGGNYPDLAMST